MSTIGISLTLYGGGCVFIVLIAQLLGSLLAAAGLELSLCLWMVIVAACLTPLTWMGTPKDFWPIAVGALITTCVACLLIVVTCVIDGLKYEVGDISKIKMLPNGTESASPMKYFPDPTADGLFKGIKYNFWQTFFLNNLFSLWINHVCFCWCLNLSNNSG